MIAEALCHYLEEKKIRCWMAPRNILPGQDYAEAIIHAMDEVKVFILVYSSFSLNSQWVKKETNVAVSKEKLIIPFRIEDCSFEGTSMELYLNDRHWIDAVPDPNAAFGPMAEALLTILGNSSPVSPAAPAANGPEDARKNEEISKLQQQLEEGKKKLEQLQKQAADPTETSPYKRFIFLMLGIFLGFLGVHFLYVHRMVLFFVTVSLFVLALITDSDNLGAIVLIGGLISAFAVTKDGKRRKMLWF